MSYRIVIHDKYHQQLRDIVLNKVLVLTACLFQLSTRYNPMDQN